MLSSIRVCSEKEMRAGMSLTLIGTHSANFAMPALPGAQKSSSGCVAFLRNAQISACSRPPDPMTRIFIVSQRVFYFRPVPVNADRKQGSLISRSQQIRKKHFPQNA
jgi:hypothetical protein